MVPTVFRTIFLSMKKMVNSTKVNKILNQLLIVII